MSFDISKLTSAVNKYLYSISDVSAAADKAAAEIEEKSRFRNELNDAIRQNIESRMREPSEIPDIGEVVREQMQQAVGTIDATFEQVNGAFEDMRNAGKTVEATDAVKAADASKVVDASSGTDSSDSAKKTTDNSNYDAYSGVLSTKALQELSRSQYFSSNLIQSSLFQENAGSSTDSGSANTLATSLSSALESASGTASPFDNISLSDLNTASLTQGGDDTKAATTDLARALIKAYAQSSPSKAATSIFGDFSL